MFNEKTGNPSHDNAARNLNRQIRRRTANSLRVNARGWKRRKVILRAELATYRRLVIEVMNQKHREDNPND